MSIAELYARFSQTSGICTDSRKVTPNSFFFALKGGNFDGNRFAAVALERGAKFAVVDNPAVALDERYIVVPEVLTALQDLAQHHRRQFHIPIIGITGSNGKTTTKELISAVLGSHYRLHYTAGNFNNHIGVPLTLLAMPPGLEVAVIEMGANAQGEIANLSRIAEPTHGLITNIGKAHLEGFGGIEGVKKGKSELYRYLAAHGGLAFINQDEKFLTELAEPVRKKVFYGASAAPQKNTKPIEIKLVADQPSITYAFLDENDDLVEGTSHLPGQHNFNNIMTAVALGKYFKVPSGKIIAAIANYLPQMNRSEWQTHGTNRFLLDAYNANPSSMESALRTFAATPAQRRVVILGDMFELGAAAPAEHQRMAELAASLGFDEVILVGENFAPAAATQGWRHFPEGQALKSWFDQQNWQHTHFMLKGSRGMRLEQLLDAPFKESA